MSENQAFERTVHIDLLAPVAGETTPEKGSPAISPTATIDITPVSLLAFVGAELFRARLRELAAQCDTRRRFNRAMENEILPSIRALFDDRVAHDVLRAAREVYGMRGEHAQAKEGPQEERPAVAPTSHGEEGRANVPSPRPREKSVSADATGRRL